MVCLPNFWVSRFTPWSLRGWWKISQVLGCALDSTMWVSQLSRHPQAPPARISIRTGTRGAGGPISLAEAGASRVRGVGSEHLSPSCRPWLWGP